MDQLSEERLLAELEPEVRALFTQVRGIDGGCLLLRFLDQHANVLMTIEDIAFHLCEPSDAVESTLDAMRELGLVREVVVAGITFFGVTNDCELRQTIGTLCCWQDRWHQRLAEIKRMLTGEAKAN